MSDIKEQAVQVAMFLRDTANMRAMTMEQLDKPTMQRLGPVYLWFVQKLTDCPENALSQPWFLMTDIFEHHELHDYSALIVSLCLSVNIILDHAGFKDDFFIRDLLTPKKMKTIRILHHLVTFYSARASRAHVVDDIWAQANEAVENMRYSELENEQLKERINGNRIRLAQCQPILDQLQKEEKSCEDQFRKKQEEVKSLDQESTRIETEFKNQQETHALSCQKADRMRNENEQLNLQIVSSPEKLPKELKELEEEKAEVAARVREMNSNIAREMEKKTHLAQVESSLNSIISLVDELLREKEKLEAEKEVDQKLLQQLDALHLALESSIRSADRKRNTLKSRGVQSKNVKERAEPRVVELRQKMSYMKSELDRFARETRVDKTASANMVQSSDSTRAAVKQLEDDHVTVKEAARQSICKLKKGLEKVQESAFQYFDMLNSEMKKELGT